MVTGCGPEQASCAGTKLKLEGKVDDGLAHYEEAIEICETYGPAYYNIGVVHSEAKQVESKPSFHHHCHYMSSSSFV